MSKSNFIIEHLFRTIFLGKKFIGPPKILYLSLHHNVPQHDQIINEVDYVHYIRIGIPCTSKHWKLEGNKISNIHPVRFRSPALSERLLFVSHFALGIMHEGHGEVIYKGQLDAIVAGYDIDQLVFMPGHISVEEV